MKIRRRQYKYRETELEYWPSFVDVMTTVSLSFFFIMILAMGLLTVFVDDISSKRADLYDKIEAKLQQNNVDPSIINFNREEGKIDILTETFFDSDSDNLKEDGVEVADILSKIFFELLSDEHIKSEIDYIEVIGHTDFAGSTIYGRTLSTNRAVSFLNEMVPENSEIENLHGEKFKASGMSEFENYATKEERDRGDDEYDVEETKNDRRIEIRMTFNNRDLEEAIKQRWENKNKNK